MAHLSEEEPRGQGQQLKEQETQFEAIFAASANAMMVYDTTGTVVRANPAAIETHGFNPVGMQRKAVTENVYLRHPDGRPISPDELPSVRALSGRPVERERQLLTNAKGTELIVLASASPLTVDGEIRGAVVVWHDITERERLIEQLVAGERAAQEAAEREQVLREELEVQNEELESQRQELQALNEELEGKVIERTRELVETNEQLRLEIVERRRAERELQDSEERYRQLVEFLPDAVAVHREGRIVFANAVAARLLGTRTPEEIIGKPVMELVHPDSRPIATAWLRQIAEQGKEAPLIEEKFLRPDGTAIDVEVASTPMVFRGMPSMLSVARDITERKRLVYELRESEARFRAIFEGAAIGVTLGDLEGKSILSNPALQSMLGYSDDELRGMAFPEYTHPDDVGANLELFRRLVAGEHDHYQMEKRYIRKNGEVFWINLTVSGVRDADNRLGYVVGMIEDVTCRKRAERDLEASLANLQRSLDGAVGAMSLMVELRDPYTAGHQRRVATLSCVLAEEMSLPENQIRGIRVAATLHDIGKICLPAEILSKPSRLSNIELSMVQSHSQIGYDILKNVEFPWAVADFVLQHHEKVDGSGYPLGLTEEEILLEARILAVADVVEAMASHRPYRAALGVNRALEEIAEKRGVLYDSDVVDACRKLFETGSFRFE